MIILYTLMVMKRLQSVVVRMEEVMAEATARLLEHFLEVVLHRSDKRMHSSIVINSLLRVFVHHMLDFLCRQTHAGRQRSPVVVPQWCDLRNGRKPGLEPAHGRDKPIGALKRCAQERQPTTHSRAVVGQHAEHGRG